MVDPPAPGGPGVRVRHLRGRLGRARADASHCRTSCGPRGRTARSATTWTRRATDAATRPRRCAWPPGSRSAHAGLHRVQAGVMPRNTASIRVVEKNGFRFEGLARNYLQINGVWEDHILYALTTEDWRGERAETPVPRRRSGNGPAPRLIPDAGDGPQPARTAPLPARSCRPTPGAEPLAEPAGRRPDWLKTQAPHRPELPRAQGAHARRRGCTRSARRPAARTSTSAGRSARPRS